MEVCSQNGEATSYYTACLKRGLFINRATLSCFTTIDFALRRILPLHWITKSTYMDKAKVSHGRKDGRWFQIFIIVAVDDFSFILGKQ